MINKLKFLSLYYAYPLIKPFKRPVPPKLASTIMLVRERKEGLEVFMVERHHQIDFASGALVFPGGKVDPPDCLPELRSFCDGVDGIDNDALGLRIAAIREVFEECGILLARIAGEKNLLNAEQLKPLESYREALHKQKVDMKAFVLKENLRLACDQLHSFAHWITPEMIPKRFDTYFYLVQTPEGQIGLHDGQESVDSLWITPQTALKAAKDGKRIIIFPTRLNLEKLGAYQTIKEVLQFLNTSPVHTVMPKLLRKGLRVFLTIPEKAGYGKIEEPLENVM
ncbi:NUDIX domain-containing protein [Deltaproteobacteria bacterium TL4]